MPRFFKNISSGKIPALEKVKNTFFARLQNGTFFIFFQCQDFSKKSPVGKSRHWKKWKTRFLPVIFMLQWEFYKSRHCGTEESDFRMRFLPVSLQCGNGYLYYTGSLNKKTGIPSGDPYRNFCQKLVTPTGFFLLGRATFYYHGSPPRGGRFTSRPTAYVGPALPALEDACSLVFPLIFECHFIFCFSWLILLQDFLTLCYSFYFPTINAHLCFPTVVSKILP